MVSAMRTLLLVTLLLSGLPLAAQKIEVSNEIVSSSDFEDSHDNHLGNGYMDKLKVGFDMPLSVKFTQDKQPIMWRIMAGAVYGRQSTNGEAKEYNPDDIFNATVNVMHIRPLKGRWSLLATVGAGLHTTFDDTSARDIFINAAAIFSYRHDQRLSYGVGVALTNTFGWPLILPMPYVRYQAAAAGGKPVVGAWDFDVNFMGRMQFTAGTWLTERLKLNIDGFNMENLHANVKVDGDYKVYSMSTWKSGVRPELTIGKKGCLMLAAGWVWRRSVGLADRSWAGFFKSFNRNRRHTFGRSGYITIGYSTKL